MLNFKRDLFEGGFYIFGAQATAIGAVRAISALLPECKILGVIVSNIAGNPARIDNYKVETTEDIVAKIGKCGVENAKVFIATTIYVQDEIETLLRNKGFRHIKRINPDIEAELMRRYYDHLGLFPSVYAIHPTDEDVYKDKVSAYIFEVHTGSDYKLKNEYSFPAFTHKFWTGIYKPSTDGFILDNSGDNIAEKNGSYCELTAFYWMWKNIDREKYDYLGICQYRRFLKVSEEELQLCKDSDVDIILPYPMICLPDINYHHRRYTNDPEWEAVLQAVEELYPDYFADHDRIFSRPYMYNYNMLIIKPEIYNEYAEWLFKICYRAEEIYHEQNLPETSRYMGYLSESLLTWFVVHNEYRFNIRHAERMLRV